MGNKCNLFLSAEKVSAIFCSAAKKLNASHTVQPFGPATWRRNLEGPIHFSYIHLPGREYEIVFQFVRGSVVILWPLSFLGEGCHSVEIQMTKYRDALQGKFLFQVVQVVAKLLICNFFL